MAKTLLVVESPAKAKTIRKYLGADFDVRASIGHIKDLPTSAEKESAKSLGDGMRKGRRRASGSVVGVDLANNFAPAYQIIPGKEKIVNELREAAKGASRVLLATDPDREGEAIAWHLSEELGRPFEDIYRVLFNELTEKTIKAAVASPSRLDPNRYNAQQTRRILDRIVGYQVSPLLWKKVQYGLSAGRVQSVALRLIADRQTAIDTFVPVEYWSVTSLLAASAPPPFEAKLVEAGGAKAKLPNASAAREIVRRAHSAVFRVVAVKRKKRLRNAPPPFITSTLQQEASRKLGMPASRTMRTAQRLYEGIELGPKGAVGLITYMRTDSPRTAPEALLAVRSFIGERFGADYLPQKPNTFKVGKAAQEAHEAIRPTSMEFSPESIAHFLDKDQRALYRLIWDRFIASQMAPAIFDQTTADISAADLLFRATGSILKFDGFLKVFRHDDRKNAAEDNEDDPNRQEEDVRLPPLETGMTLDLKALSPRQHFSQPPPPFNEATLIKELEELGIGRPSTYADIVSTIRKRKYVELTDKRFKPTPLGRIVGKLLRKSFPDLLDTKFTADLESSLDRIEEGEVSWIDTLAGFYGPFSEDLRKADEEMANLKRNGFPTHRVCPVCGEGLILRSGRFGLFLGCSAYPTCSYTSNIPSDHKTQVETLPSDQICPDCGSPMVIRVGRSGPFHSCSRYPACKAVKPFSTGVPCPKCGSGELAKKKSKKGKIFYSCTRYPECDFAMWREPVAHPCPNPACDSLVMEVRSTAKSGERTLQCPKCNAKHIVKGENSAA
jgi:DNA topoisomerase-1